MSLIKQNIVILGGGTAGWLTANILAAEFDPHSGIKVTLVESPTTPTIGVGEGTWPSMRSTLLKIGISEKAFIQSCSATLKQGTYFKGWASGESDEYYHPFTLPHGFADLNLAEYWNAGMLGEGCFAESVTPQFAACEAGLAPKQIQVPEYAYTLNYGYHLDAGKFAELLRTNAVDHLGVTHVIADVNAVRDDIDGNSEALETTTGELSGELFVDCSGFRSLLLGDHYEVPLSSQRDILFNDRALAAQVPYNDPFDSIATTTRATAHHAGWFWDIGLQHRRGVGAVFSSQHTDLTRMEQALDQYLRDTGYSAGLSDTEARLIEFEPGYRLHFHLAPPVLNPRGEASSVPKKQTFGPWVRHAFSMLSALRRLRNTPLDPFAWSDERKRAREDLANYADDLTLLGNIDLEANYEPARALAALPRTLRGFGHVRQANRARLAQERTVLMRQLGVGGSSEAADSPLIWSQE